MASQTFPTSVPQTVKDQRRRIWAGIIEYQERPAQPVPINPSNRITHTLQCHVSCHVVNGEPEINAEKWPHKLVLSLIPKLLIIRLFPILKSASYHISLHFTNYYDKGLSNLSKIMSTNWVGCIQFTAIKIRMVIILYIPDRGIYVGFVPHDQEEFTKAMREIIETNKTEQQVIQQQQKVLQQMSCGSMQQMSGFSLGSGLPIGNTVSSTQMGPGLDPIPDLTDCFNSVLQLR